MEYEVVLSQIQRRRSRPSSLRIIQLFLLPQAEVGMEELRCCCRNNDSS